MVPENDQLTRAIEDLRSQKRPNIQATAKKYSLDRSTLSRRFRGKTTSRQEATSIYHKYLTNTQEQLLIRHINQLTDKAIPTTSTFVKNLAQEICGHPLGKNWVSTFVKRYKDQLKSLYLCNIDNLQTKAEYAPSFKLFFELVEYFKLLFKLILTTIIII